MSKKKVHKISKSKLVKLNEDNLMFITNPGRMGDEDGLTFIIKENEEFIIYRVDGLMYQRGDIILNDIKKQFPKWAHTWKHFKEKEHNGKYKYLYMGFGNGLCIDSSIYNEFKEYLDMYLKDITEEDRYGIIFNNWEMAFMNMVEDKGYILK